MKKNLLLILLLIFFYYVSTFFISFINISQHISNNNSLSLDKYINKKNIQQNFRNDILDIKEYIINNHNSNIKIENDSFSFTGELTPSFYDRFFIVMANNISKELSEGKVMLYFYFNSKILAEYFNQYLSNFGEYSFEKFISKMSSEADNINKDLTNNNQNSITNNELKGNLENLMLKLIKKYQYTDYFFLISPIHFKLKVNHQDLPFSVILKFNGYKWKINEIVIPYKSYYSN